MLARIISEQSIELKRLQSLVSIDRDVLPNSLVNLSNNLIKVVTGPRRAGKSTFALQLLRGEKIAYLNFDDENLLAYLSKNGTIQLEEELKKVYGEFKFIFFDEIQTLESWELLVSRLQRKGYNLILSGSNAKLLSSELSTHLTGRFVEINILPFSWTEFIKASEGANIQSYLARGGFPELAVTNVEPRNYLENLAQAILMKDIVTRRKIRQVGNLNSLYRYLCSIPTGSFSYESLCDASEIGSKHTAKNYLNYFKEAWLCIELKKFSIKQKEQQKAQRKIYPIDPGMINDSLLILDSLSRKLETQVLIDLLRSGLDPETQIYFYRTKNDKEIDFVVKSQQGVDMLIQVCLDMSDKKTRTREISALLEASKELYCNKLLIVTLYASEIVDGDQEIKVIPVADFRDFMVENLS